MLERVLHHWPLKLLSLTLAFAIWYSVIDESRTFRDFTVPVEVLLADSQTAASDVPTTAQVRLEGTETGIRRADRVGMSVSVNGMQFGAGEHEVLLTRANVTGIPAELDLRFINPERIRLTVADLVRRRLPVEPTLLGKPADGYSLYSVEVSPKQIDVSGPSTEVEAMTVLRTNPIRLDGKTSPFTVNVIIRPDGNYARILGDAEVQVEVLVDQIPVERRFENVPVILDGSTGNLSYSPKTVHVTLSGPPDLLNGLEPELLRAVADVKGLDPGDGELQVSIAVDFLQVPLEDLVKVTVKSYSTREVTIRKAEA